MTTNDFSTSFVPPSESNRSKNANAALGAAAAGGMILYTAQPANAGVTTPGVSDIQTMIGDIGTLTSGIITVVIAAMGARLAIKFANRLTVKG